MQRRSTLRCFDREPLKRDFGGHFLQLGEGNQNYSTYPMSTWGYPIPWNQFQSDRSPSKSNHIIEEPGYVNHAAPPGGHLKHKRCSNEVLNYLGQCVTGAYGEKIQLLYHKWTPDGFLLFKIKSRPFFGRIFRSGAAVFQAFDTKLGTNVALVPAHNIKQTAFKSDHYKY